MPSQVRAGERRRVVIVGGGFGGAYAAQTLSRALPDDWNLTLIDRNNFLLFYPLLVEAGVGTIEPRHVVVPIRKFMKRGEFIMGEVHHVDLQAQQVGYQVIGSAGEERLHYDHLILAPGSVTKLPDVPGLKEHGFELKSLADSVEFRDRGIRLLELANTIEDREDRRALLRIVVVGSNFTGIELAGEYQDFLHDASKQYENVETSDVQVVVLEYADRILPALDPELAQYAHRHLEKRGLVIRTKTTLTEIRHGEVTLSTGEVMRTHTPVWAAGIAPSPLIQNISGLPLGERGYIKTDDTLRVHGMENVWAVGDSAQVLDSQGKPYAATAQNATRQGTIVAKNIIRAIRGESPKPFVYSGLGSVAALGCRTAVAKVMGIKLSGLIAWWLYRTIYVMKMPSWSRRIRIILDWTVDLFMSREPVQLGVRRPDPVLGGGMPRNMPVTDKGEADREVTYHGPASVR
jgi:NADH:ubiquinone reductase (H+-translocating)